MNIAMIGSFHGKKTEINVIVENEDEVIYLDYPYVFINIYFAHENPLSTVP